MELDKQVTDVDMEEDSTDSLPEVKADSLENPSKKAASIKIKTPKTLSSIRNQAGNAAGREVESKQPKELKEPVRNSQFNKQELDSALLVVRKVMKMDAAEPFIAPVDPIALGIPVNVFVKFLNKTFILTSFDILSIYVFPIIFSQLF
ncbi:hypothetical protein SAY86_024812 [Trapa natans]|uniref:Uncharacterized protein n=1 Tax=Trapa natans TaxID=22666 RepID=A0AAN7MHY6_TRANT|nr:hypothetical protein SAY86_024812 [Trapa natans]